MKSFKEATRMIRFLVSVFILCFALEGVAKIVYPDFDQSMLRLGLHLEKEGPHCNIKEKQQYEMRNQNLISFFREMYYRNIAKTAEEEEGCLRIPRIVHQIWLGSPVPEKFRNWMDTWVRLEGWEYKLWTENEISQLFLYNQALYEESTNFGEKSDIVRLEVLSQFGGVYVDVDLECLRPEIFEELHCSFDFYIGFEPLEHGYTSKFNMFKVCNAIMASTPNHPLIKDMIVNLRANYFAYRNCCTAIHRTGPSYLTRIICEYEQSGAHCNRNMYLPCTFFYPFSEPEARYLYQYRAVPIWPETAGIHYWCGSWWEKPKREPAITIETIYPEQSIYQSDEFNINNGGQNE